MKRMWMMLAAMALLFALPAVVQGQDAGAPPAEAEAGDAVLDEVVEAATEGVEAVADGEEPVAEEAEDEAVPGTAATAAVPAEDEPKPTSPWRVFALLGACLGAGVIVIGGGISISRISSQALESIARQPEAAGQMFLAWLIPAAMIEGGMLFGVTICLLVLYS